MRMIRAAFLSCLVVRVIARCAPHCVVSIAVRLDVEDLGFGKGYWIRTLWSTRDGFSK
jgi:hypothetical protein